MESSVSSCLYNFCIKYTILYFIRVWIKMEYKLISSEPPNADEMPKTKLKQSHLIAKLKLS